MTEVAAALRDFLAIGQALGPLGIIFFLWWDGKKESKRWEERFREEYRQWAEKHQAVVRMYENNIELVKLYAKFANEQQDLIIMNTNAFTELTTIIKERVK